MLYLIDKLIIVFLYVNILAPKVTIAFFPFGKLLIGLALFLYLLYAMTHSADISTKSISYIFISITFISILSLIGIFKGNQISNIINYITPIFILFTIPVFYSLFRLYNIERYISHVLNAVVILALYICIIFIFCGILNMRELVSIINENLYFMSAVSYPPSGIRISVVTGGFLPIGLLIAYYFIIKKPAFRYYLFFAIISFALYLSQTLILWFCGVFVLLFFTFFRIRKISSKMIAMIALLIIIGLLAITTPQDFIAYKEESFIQKGKQIVLALDMFGNKPFLGEGLGYVYRSSIVPGAVSREENVVLEVSYAMILSSTGLIGVLFYSFIYLYYPFKFLLKKSKNLIMKLFFVSHLAVLIAGISNPYIWSGGMGLLFICFLSASMESPMQSSDIHKVALVAPLK